MVHLFRWPLACHPKPRKTVGKILFIFESDLPIFFQTVTYTTGHIPLNAKAAPALCPCKDASSRVIVDPFAEKFCGKAGQRLSPRLIHQSAHVGGVRHWKVPWERRCGSSTL